MAGNMSYLVSVWPQLGHTIGALKLRETDGTVRETEGKERETERKMKGTDEN